MARKPHADELGLHYVAHIDQPTEWKKHGKCSGLTKSDHPMSQAWNLRTPRERLWVDGHLYTGQTLIDFALQTCEICPVQWDCASFAAHCQDFYSTYSMLGTDMRWLVKSGKADTIIEAARENNVSMQRAVALAREAATVAPCPTSAPPSSSTTEKPNSRSRTAKSRGLERTSRASRSANGATQNVA